MRYINNDFISNCFETINSDFKDIINHFVMQVISGQSLPKPRGSSATKANFIDPYVVIQIFGIPADCAGRFLIKFLQMYKN